MELRYGLQIDATHPVEDDLSQLLVELILGRLQALLQLQRNKLVSIRPFLEYLGDQVMCKAFVLLMSLLDRVVIGIECHSILDQLKCSIIDIVTADRQFLQSKVLLESLANLLATFIINLSIEHIKFNE